jgi:ComF family protein
MGLIDLVFPKKCLGCGREGRYICPSCMKKAPLARPICPYCKHPSIDGATHANCSRKFGVDGLSSIWEYEGIIRKVVMSLKYKRATSVGVELTEYLFSSLNTKVLPPIQYLIPVPVHWYRQNARGFNQSVEVGGKIAEKMRLKFIPDLLIKTVQTKPQAGLSREERRKNLKGSFVVNSTYKSLIPNLDSIFLFDDVFTTGSTMFEATKVLKRAGIKKVWGITISR